MKTPVKTATEIANAKPFDQLRADLLAAHDRFKTLNIHSLELPQLTVFADVISESDRAILQDMLVQFRAIIEAAENEFSPQKVGVIRNEERQRLAADPRGGKAVRTTQEISIDLQHRRCALFVGFAQSNISKYLAIVKPAIEAIESRIEAAVREAVEGEAKLAKKWGIHTAGHPGYVTFTLLALHHRIGKTRHAVNGINPGQERFAHDAELLQLLGVKI